MGSNIAITSANIARLFDYIILGAEDYYFLGQLPKPLPQINNLFYPFDMRTWLMLCASLACTTIVFISIHKAHKVCVFKFLGGKVDRID